MDNSKASAPANEKSCNQTLHVKILDKKFTLVVSIPKHATINDLYEATFAEYRQKFKDEEPDNMSLISQGREVNRSQYGNEVIVDLQAKNQNFDFTNILILTHLSKNRLPVMPSFMPLSDSPAAVSTSTIALNSSVTSSLIYNLTHTIGQILSEAAEALGKETSGDRMR